MGNARKVKKAPGARRRGGLGAGGHSLELDRPMGKSLSEEVQAPPPPPLPLASKPAPVPAPSFAPLSEEPASSAKPPPPARDAPPPPAAARPAHPSPPPAAAASPAPKPAKGIDLDLLPWIVKKQLAIETDREDLDFEIALQVEGKRDRLVIEGHRNDFGRIYVRAPAAPQGQWKRYADSEFAATALEDVFKTFQGHIVGVAVKSGPTEIEFESLADFLEWAKY